MSQRRSSWLVPRLIVCRTAIISTLAAVFVLSSSLVAQQPATSAPPSQSNENAAVTYSQGTQDNLPPLPNESAPPSSNAAASTSAPIPPAPNASVPPSLTIPAGTLVTVRLMGGLSSDVNQQGDSFSATLEQPIVVDGWVVGRPGQIAVGKVVSAQQAGRVKGVSSLGVGLSELPVVNGRELPVASQLVQTSAGTSKGRDAVGVAATTGLGAAIGGAVDGG
ncbi:MAG: hypothetical protein WBS19_16325, partial [Candidatus Korobacteraceae bacterium]